MRLLVLYQACNALEDQPGYYDGFQRLVSEGMLSAHAAIPYRGIAEQHGWNTLWSEAYNTAREMQADAIFLQFFHGAIPDPSQGILRLRDLPERPLIFTSLGDPFGRWTHRVPKAVRTANALSDVTFLSGMGYLALQLKRWGSRNLVLMPHAYCDVLFGSPAANDNGAPTFDVVFVGNRVGSRNPASHFYWVVRPRMELVVAFTRRYGGRFGLFGSEWDGNPCWHGPLPFARQQAVYRQAAVVLGGMPNGYYDYYMSDRPFIAAGSGTPLVDYWVPGTERILEPEVEWWPAKDINSMIKRCDYLLQMPQSERHALGERARKAILASHTHYHRCREMVEIVRDTRAARLEKRKAKEPKLSFLAHSTRAQDIPPAIVAWQG